MDVFFALSLSYIIFANSNPSIFMKKSEKNIAQAEPLYARRFCDDKHAVLVVYIFQPQLMRPN